MAADFSSPSPLAHHYPSRTDDAQQHHPPPQVRYEIVGMAHSPEDIIFCVDTDRQVDAEMKVTGAKGQALIRLDAIKQAILLFVHSKLTIHPHHRFAFATVASTASSLQRGFTNDMNIINNSVRNLRSSGSFQQCELEKLFQLAASEAKKSQAQGRIMRVVLIYCRSDVVPTYPAQWPESRCLFTFDALYLHDKPSQQNCPQQVYDALVEALERVSLLEGYIYESGSGLSRVLFRQMSCLLAHPQQRCGQDDFGVPKDIAKASVSLDGTASPTPIKREDDASASHSFA